MHRIVKTAVLACALALTGQAAAAKPAALDDQLTQATSAYLDKPSAKKMQRIQALLAKGARPHHAQTGEGDAGLAALPFAIAAPSPELVKLFLARKPDLEIPVIRENPLTPLQLAVADDEAESEDMLQVISLLLAAGADINNPGPNRLVTPVMLAAGYGGDLRPLLLQRLLQAGADANRPNMDNANTINAMAAGNLDAIRLLQTAGAKLDNRSDSGETALHQVCARPEAEQEQADPQAGERIRLFKAAGLSLNQQPPAANGDYIVMPLAAAVESGNRDCVKAMLAEGADAELPVFAHLTAEKAEAEGLDNPSIRQYVQNRAEELDGEMMALFRR
ncbi:ankyrin repeat domain-containing protein [Chromobacterium vaccinii]|uniref:Ankyrin repeat domain-containing protein n=1 Tax=Chromobacterium vaccinii TaxID=1108595 RepID=A0ABV0FCX9_9NEIS